MGTVSSSPNASFGPGWQLQEYLRIAVRDETVGHEVASRIVTIDKTMRNDGSFQGEWGDRAPRNAIVVAKHNAYSGKTSEADKRACVKAATQRLDLRRRPQIPALLRACQIKSDGGIPGPRPPRRGGLRGGLFSGAYATQRASASSSL